MSSVYNPEAELMQEIEKLELETRELRQRLGQAHNEEDKRVLSRQLGEIEQQIEFLRKRLP